MAIRSTLPFALDGEDRRLRALESRNFIILFSMAIISCLLFNFRDYVAYIVDSGDICSSQLIRDMSGILLPKLNTHCEQISLAESFFRYGFTTTTAKFTHFYGRHDILVILDIWIAIAFISQFLLQYRGNIWIYRARNNDIYLFWKQRPIHCLFIVLIGCLFLFGTIILAFFWYPTGSIGHSPLNWKPVSLFSWADMVSDYGIGVFIATLVPQALVLTRTPFVFLHVMVSHNAKP